MESLAITLAEYEPPYALASFAILIGLCIVSAIWDRCFRRNRPLSRKKPEHPPDDSKHTK